MEIVKESISGTLESSDIMIKVEKSESDCLEIILHSTVSAQFGDEIKEVVTETLSKLGVTSGIITLHDKGALDCTIIARLKAAIYRACESNNYLWEE